jgi:small nuclear ribonucleoprotein (snRNP)-like protein
VPVILFVVSPNGTELMLDSRVEPIEARVDREIGIVVATDERINIILSDVSRMYRTELLDVPAIERGGSAIVNDRTYGRICMIWCQIDRSS